MDEKNPTTDEIRHYLIVDNGWHHLEVKDLLKNHAEAVNEDGTTNASRDQWSKWAQEEAEGN